ncbi:hypothetical protein COCNU_05G008770 [Cocos nucifera]|uniref:Uncharacterized protein n=1 Tax=Cocos nucifera TaxID=13894 RepID=A0A8K0I974_COCNU|nr:hypothetical protein COCNU_05G008770 [Cocos nucifera]
MMATLKSTVSLTYHRPSFGIRVTSTSLDISYLKLKLATGKMDDFHQSKESQRDLNEVVTGNKVPLYGAGSSLSSTRRPVPLILRFSLRSTAHLVGVLVKSNFHTTIQC